MKYSAEDLKKIAHYEEKRNIKYAKAGGRLYNRLFFFGIISWVYMLSTSFAYVIGRSFTISAGTDNLDNPFITIIISSVVALLSILLYIFRLRISFFVLNMVSALITFLSFAGIAGVDDSVSSAGSSITEYDQGYFGLKKIFYWRHGIPIILLFIFFAVLIFIILREKSILKKEFNLISQNNYEPQIITDDE